MSQPGIVRVHPDVVFQKLGEEAVLLNLRTGVYWGLDRAGALVWDEIVSRGELNQIVTALQGAFTGTEAEIRSIVSDLLGDLSRAGLVVMGEEN